jgi:S-(hydroxymethyl)glutathione dehydrogenase / alcohol dehydrogenase
MRVDAPVLFEAGKPMTLVSLEVDGPHTGEVLVRMAASGVCHSCLSAANGTQTRAPKPIVLGDEGAGVVEAVGVGVSRLAPGDHVILSWAPGCGRCVYCERGRPVLCSDAPPFGFLADGTTRFSIAGSPVHHFGPATYSPYTVVPERAAVRIPADFPLDLAALVGCSVTTGVGAVVNTGKVRAGDGVAVFGCGGIGLNAVQGARLVGAYPIVAIDPVEDRLAEARALGATHVINPNSVADVTAALLESVGAVECAVIAVGLGNVVSQAFQTLAPGGVAVAVGVPPPGTSFSVDPGLLLGGERRLVGSKYGSANPLVEFPRIVELAAAGLLELERLVTRRYTIGEANEAFADLEAGHLARGLIVFDAD